MRITNDASRCLFPWPAPISKIHTQSWYALALGLFLAPMSVFCQIDVTRYLFTPPVVPETQVESVRFEVTVIGNPPSVVFEYSGADRPMFDDGTNGDQVAGDGTWTIMFTASEILSRNVPSRVFRPFIGFLRVEGGGRFNVFAEVWTSEIGLREIRPVKGGGQQTDYIVNYTATRDQLMNFDRRVWAQRFYQTYGDNFDFINFVLAPGRRGNRNHVHVSNSVHGIGVSIFDATADYGSGGRLKGVNYYPITFFYDGGEKAFNHETGHQWVNFLANTPFSAGRPHWPRGSVAGNVMGFSQAGGVGGDFPYTFTPNGSGGYVVGQSNTINLSTFNSMELYLMGLIPPEEVGEFFVLADQSQTVTVGQTLQPSEVMPALISHVLSTYGPRVPASTQSQKDFRVATIVISEQLLDAHAISLYDYFARRTEAREPLAFSSGFATGTCNPWYLATGGRSVMTAALNNSSFDISGRVSTSGGRGIGNAWVTMTDTNGIERFATTSAFGHFRFAAVAGGQSYTVTVRAKRYQFTPRTIQVNQALSNVDFIAQD